MGLLDDADLSSLNSAIKAAEQSMAAMADSTRSTLEGLQDELDQLEGRTADIERRKFAARQRDLQAQLAEAQANGDTQAVANASRALGMLRQIEAASEQQRQAAEQKKRQEEIAKAVADQTPAPQAGPTKIIRLETPTGKTFDFPANDSAAETRLLDVLADAGLRAI